MVLVSVNTLHDETHEAEVDTLPNSPSTLAIPSFEPQKEEIPPPNFMLDIESDLFADFGNISNYQSIDRPKMVILAFVCQVNIN